MKGSELKGLREAMRLTLEDLAREVGYSAMSVSRFERGVQAIPEAVAEKVRALAARHLGVRPPAPITEVSFATIEGSTSGVTTVKRSDGSVTTFTVAPTQRVVVSGDAVLIESRTE